ncbi:MAG: ribose-phosphate pyrophosphokinase [Acutalibacteraceae bacterium]|nr:ribose-phosphate pyrophosphokinase [Acutalibacteraceae bacterium]
MIKLNNKPIEIRKFPDGTLLIKEDIQKDFSCNRSETITWLFENNEELVVLIYITKHLQSHGVEKIHLDMPYIPNARQDRVKSNEDVFTMKYFADVINWLGFASITVLDPHSSVSEALLNNIVIKTPKENINRVISKIGSENLIMFYPDEGAMKRYSAIIDKPYVFGIKKRDWSTGKINGLNVAGAVELVPNNRILIVDDICSKGGTFYYSALKLKELGSKEIYLYISHCENTILQGEILTSGLIEKVFTTDSLFTEKHERIEVFYNE